MVQTSVLDRYCDWNPSHPGTISDSMAVWQAGMVTQAQPQLLRFYLDRGPGEQYHYLMITNGGGGPSFFWSKVVQRF